MGGGVCVPRLPGGSAAQKKEQIWCTAAQEDCLNLHDVGALQHDACHAPSGLSWVSALPLQLQN
jgi:hypothetical protein